MPDIDLFEPRLNKQLDNYISWFPDPNALTSDAFSVCWSVYSPYIFPPFSLVGRILQKIEEDKVRKAILVNPMWVTQTWFPKLLQMLVQDPLRLPIMPELLRLVHINQFHPLNKRKLFLFACAVSGISLKVKAYQNKLSLISKNHGEFLQIEHMNLYGTNGIFCVVEGKLIPCSLLK